MAIVRVEKNKNYTVMSNYHLKEKEMSLKAKGLLSVMLSLPEGWDFSIEGLCSICVENITAIRNTLKELENFKYLVIEKKKNDKGQFIYEYVVYENPHIENPHIENPHIENLYMENLYMENQLQLNTNKYNNNSSNIIDSSKDIDSSNILHSNTNKLNTKEIKESIIINNNTKEKKKKFTKNDLLDIVKENYDDEDIINAFSDYIDDRDYNKKPMNPIAIKRACNELKRLSSNKEEQLEIINQSILNRWQGLFALKNKNGIKKPILEERKYVFSENDNRPITEEERKRMEEIDKELAW